MTEAVIIQKPVKSMDCFRYDNGLRDERVKWQTLENICLIA